MHDATAKAEVTLEMTIHRADGTVEKYAAPAQVVNADALKAHLSATESQQTPTKEEQNG